MSEINYPTGNSLLIAALNQLRQVTAGSIDPVTGLITGEQYNENDAVLFDTNQNGTCRSMLISDFAACPATYYFKGTYERIYFRYLEGLQDAIGNVRAGHGHVNRINYFDISTKRFGYTDFSLPTSFPLSTDAHNNASLIVSDNGYIISAVEELNGGGHNSPINIYRSDNPENISSFTRVVQLTGIEGAYPILKKTSDGTIWLYFRNRVGGNEMYLNACKSVDNGATWKSLTGVANSTTNVANLGVAGRFLYDYYVKHSESDGIHLILHDHQGVGFYGKRNYWLHTNDFITFKNAKEYANPGTGYTRNVLTEGVLTKAILDTNFTIDFVADGGTLAAFTRDACVSPIDNKLYIINGIVDMTVTGNIAKATNLWLSVYNALTDTWDKIELLPMLAKDSTYSKQWLVPVNIGLHCYGNGLIDVMINNIEHENNLADNSYPVLTSGTLIGGVFYRVVAVGTPGYFGTGVVAGDIIKGNGVLAPNATNTVRAVKQIPEIWRTFDNGAHWILVKQLRNYAYNGLSDTVRTIANPYNSEGQLYMYYSPQKSKTGNVVEYADLVYMKVL